MYSTQREWSSVTEKKTANEVSTSKRGRNVSETMCDSHTKKWGSYTRRMNKKETNCSVDHRKLNSLIVRQKKGLGQQNTCT